VPLYEYQCRKCRRRTEKIESVAGPHLKKCPHCGAGVERLVTVPAIQFKGAGWYVTDYAGKGGGDRSGAEKAETKEAPKEAPKEPPAKESKESKDSKEGKEYREKKSTKKKD
jgi:putative FmdB family regulatory protein